MHNLTKIRYFRIFLWLTYPLSTLLILPFILFKKKKPTHLFFFFDRFAMGGAQKVHLDILESVKDYYKVVYFTRKSANDKLKPKFYLAPNTECHDIHFWCDNLLFRLFTVHYYSFYINRHHKATVLGSNSTFFYDLLFFLKKKTKKIELLHNFSYGKKGMEFFGLANYDKLDLRLVVDQYTFHNIIGQYREYQVSSLYDRKVQVIEYGVPIPTSTEKPAIPPLKILYAGRGTVQKRIWLLNKIAEHFISMKDLIEFTFAGSMGNELSEIVKNNYRVYNEIGDKATMNSLFKQSHVVILTSSFEGFPVVIKEGMAFGCVPLVTDLPGNKTHLKHLYNALLMEHSEDENQVIKQAIYNINLLVKDPSLLQDISSRAYNYAKENFTQENFFREYKKLLE